MRVHSNIAEFPGRKLKLQYNTTAGGAFQGRDSSTGTKATTSNAPTKREQSMGLSGKNGIVSFFADDFGSGIVCTLYVWHKGAAKLNTGNGWIKLGAVAAENQKACDQLSIASFTIEEGIPFFIQTATQATNLFVSGSDDKANNDNTDTSDNGAR